MVDTPKHVAQGIVGDLAGSVVRGELHDVVARLRHVCPHGVLSCLRVPDLDRPEDVAVVARRALPHLNLRRGAPTGTLKGIGQRVHDGGEEGIACRAENALVEVEVEADDLFDVFPGGSPIIVCEACSQGVEVLVCTVLRSKSAGANLDHPPHLRELTAEFPG